MLGFTGLRIAAYALAVLGIAAAGIVYWYTGAVATARQEAATTRREANEKAAEFAADKAMYEREIMSSQELIAELEEKLAQAKAKAARATASVREVIIHEPATKSFSVDTKKSNVSVLIKVQ